MEYPSDKYKSSIDAMTSAFERLKAGNYGDSWITFCGQGRGHDDESDLMAEVNVRGNTFDFGDENPNLPTILEAARINRQVTATVEPDGKITLVGANPPEMARFLDAVFRKHFGIRPHDGESDYAVGAEW
jgi:hypothetical protein